MRNSLILGLFLLCCANAKVNIKILNFNSIGQYKSIIANLTYTEKYKSNITYYGEGKKGITTIKIYCKDGIICNEKASPYNIYIGFANADECKAYTKLLIKEFGKPSEYLNVEKKGEVVTSRDVVWYFNKSSPISMIAAYCDNGGLINVSKSAKVDERR